MALFFNNDCTYPNCDKIYNTLSDLIIHIEQDHLDFSLQKVDQLEIEKPDCIPLSYVLKFSNKEEPPPKYSCKNNEHIYTLDDFVFAEKCDMSPFGCDFIETKSKRKDDDNLIHTDMRLINESIAEVLPSYRSNRIILTENEKKPFACNMPGCNKRYKNVNGVKYHYKRYHKFFHIPIVKRSVLKYNHNSCSQFKVKVENTHDAQSLPMIALGSSSHHEQNYHQNFSHNNMSSGCGGHLRQEDAFIDLNCNNFYNVNASGNNQGVETSEHVPFSGINGYYSSTNGNGDMGEYALANSPQLYTKY